LIFFGALTYEVSSPQGTVMFADIGAVVLAEQKWWWVKVGASFLIVRHFDQILWFDNVCIFTADLDNSQSRL